MYTLLNYYESEMYDACKPTMKSTDPDELMKEIRYFIQDGHGDFIVENLKSTVMHVNIDHLRDWMDNPSGYLHVATETYHREWKNLHFSLVLTEDVEKYVKNHKAQ